MNSSNNNSAILTEYIGSKTLLVIFGGVKQGVGMPLFEFKNVLKEVTCDKIFLRDFKQAWYHRGLNEEIDNIESLKIYLDKLITTKEYKKVVFLGNSMGGYAAILFGNMLPVDHIIAFSPQTFISKLKRYWYKDKRWANQIEATYKDNRHQKRYYDLKPFLKNERHKLIPLDLYYSHNHKLDSIHCERLNSFNTINFYSYDLDNHNLVRFLRDKKLLLEIINLAIK
tara:strand:- start:7 stop:684 length:678 start_codon:yes stop_codon:yes gene_type:complete